jgi:plastocyanin domain-containing protein
MDYAYRPIPERPGTKGDSDMRHGWKTLLVLVCAMALTAGCQAKKEPEAVKVTTPGADIPIRVTDNGFEPSRIEVPQGSNATLVFTRVSDKTCATEVVIAGNGARLELPLNKPVRIALGTVNSTIPFACGENMYKGEVIAAPI